MKRTAHDILQLAEEQRVEFVSLQFTDILGMVKNVVIPIRELPECLDHGVWFDGSSIEGLSRVRIAESDRYLIPDLDTYALIPWDRDAGMITARMICDVYNPDGKPFAADPRQVLKRALAEAADRGWGFNVGPEIEFFLFRVGPDGRPSLEPHDSSGYFDASTDLVTHIRRRMVRAMLEFGVAVETSHHEVAVGQHEIDIRYGPALTTADHILTFRTVLKAVAQQNNLYGTLMPKPLAGVDGSGMHLHVSLSDLRDGKNLFHDANDPYNLSKLARHFVAGLLTHAPGMCAILAPLVNSYKRLVPGYEAPVYLSWGRTNRSALIRVPRTNPRRAQTTRIELRCPDPSCNPYLAFAVMLKAGMDGILNELPLPDPVEEDLYQIDARAQRFGMLPSSLRTAIEELQRDEIVAAALGPQIMERFVEAKLHEWEEYRAFVSQWELERYLMTY
jgi:glutamine synthetase